MPGSERHTRRKSASSEGERLYSVLKSGILRPLRSEHLKSVFQSGKSEKRCAPETFHRLLSTESYAERWITGQLPSDDGVIQKNSTLRRLCCCLHRNTRAMGKIRLQRWLKTQLCTAHGGHVHGEEGRASLPFCAEKTGSRLGRAVDAPPQKPWDRLTRVPEVATAPASPRRAPGLAYPCGRDCKAAGRP